MGGRLCGRVLLVGGVLIRIVRLGFSWRSCFDVGHRGSRRIGDVSSRESIGRKNGRLFPSTLNIVCMVHRTDCFATQRRDLHWIFSKVSIKQSHFNAHSHGQIGFEAGRNVYDSHYGDESCDEFADVNAWSCTVRSGSLLRMCKAGVKQGGEVPSICDEGEFGGDLIHIDWLAVQIFADNIKGIKALVHGDGF